MFVSTHKFMVKIDEKKFNKIWIKLFDSESYDEHVNKRKYQILTQKQNYSCHIFMLHDKLWVCLQIIYEWTLKIFWEIDI